MKQKKVVFDFIITPNLLQTNPLNICYISVICCTDLFFNCML